MIPDFTIVLGLDAKHFEQLKVTWPTWKKNKPSLCERKFIVFFDSDWLRSPNAPYTCDLLPDADVTTYPWPAEKVDYGTGTDKWDNPQRHKMLAGFLHVAAEHVQSPFWLKLDCDSIATGMDDWIDPEWFEGEPAIIAPPFGYTKPKMQMMIFDEWARRNQFFHTASLNLVPEFGASLLKHPRIGGWCDFFDTEFTKQCAKMTADTVGPHKLVKPSLDGFLWYCATRMCLPIKTVRMKNYGWDVRHSMGSIREAAERAMA